MALLRLASIPLFASLPEAEITHLEKTLADEQVPEGEVLFHEGHRDDKFYVLLEGQVDVVKSLGRSEERVLGIGHEGSLLGEMSLFSRDGCHTASVRALTPLHLLRVTRSELDDLLHRQPQLSYEIVRLLSQRLEESENIAIHDLKEKNRRLKKAYNQLRLAQDQIIEKEKLEKELEITRNIQKSILPESLPEVPGYEFGALMIPARYVGGDFYTFFKLPDDKWGIVVGDVSDKGVPASLFMALSYSLVRAEAMRGNSPVKALLKVNEHLLQMNSSCMFVTLVYGILDPENGDFHFARAAHPAPLLIDKKGNKEFIAMTSAQPLGVFETPPIDEKVIQVKPGSTLLLFSDGINETVNDQGVEFGYDSIHKVVAVNRGISAQDLCNELWNAVQSHGSGQLQQDDFTTFVIKRANR